MIEISSHPSILRTINFGKYAGKRVEDIANIDRGYPNGYLMKKN